MFYKYFNLFEDVWNFFLEVFLNFMKHHIWLLK